MPYKKNRSFSLFEKSYPYKPRNDPIFVYPRIHYADKNLKMACNKLFWKMIFRVQITIYD